MLQRVKKICSLQLHGQTLIEVLVALSILSIVITVVTGMVTMSLSNAQHSKNQYLATKYAQEGIEIVRKIRDSNYIGFKSYNGSYCLGKNQVSLEASQSSCTTSNVDIFIRSVIIEQSPGCALNVAKATLTVTWTDSKCSGNQYCNKSEQVSCLSTIAPMQAP